MQVKNYSRSLFTFTGFKKTKEKHQSCATNNKGRKEQYIRHGPLNHRHRQSTEVFEFYNKTVTRKTSLQRGRRRLSRKHCLNFVFPLKTKTLGLVCLGCVTCQLSRSVITATNDLIPISTKLKKIESNKIPLHSN